MLESDILYTAVESLEKLTRASIHISKEEWMNGHRWDAVIDIQAGAASGTFKVEVKNNVLPAMLPQIMDRLLAENGLLIAKYISSKGKVLLESKGINYLDIAGNCFIQNDSGIFWQIKGRQLPDEFKEGKHKAFNKNGIKLIYGLLLREAWLNESYRAMASATDISVSTIGSILEDLKKSGLLYQVNADTRMLANKKELLGLWVTAFQQKLKPKLSRGKFRFIKGTDNWKNFELGKSAWWGGEPAADLMTQYLQPSLWTIYTQLDRKSLMKNLLLVPDPQQGNVEVCKTFWNEKESVFVKPDLRTVSTLLVYADLIGSSDNRNLETANKIYEQYLKDLFEQGNG